MFLLLLVFLCVVVARCGGTQDVFVNQIESSFDAIRLAMLNKVQTGTSAILFFVLVGSVILLNLILLSLCFRIQA